MLPLERRYLSLLFCFSRLIGLSACCSVRGLALCLPDAMRSQLGLQRVAGILIRNNMINASEESLFYSRLFRLLTKQPLTIHLAFVLRY